MTTKRTSAPATRPKAKAALAPAKSLSVSEAQILGPFLEFAAGGLEAVARYMEHCGIDLEDTGDDRSARDLILEHYRNPNGSYNVDMAARDLMRWPPIAARIRKAQRESQKISFKN